MEIKAVKFRKYGFYTQPFVMGGEDGAEKYDKNMTKISAIAAVCRTI